LSIEKYLKLVDVCEFIESQNRHVFVNRMWLSFLVFPLPANHHVFCLLFDCYSCSSYLRAFHGFMIAMLVSGTADVASANRVERVVTADRAVNAGRAESSNERLLGQWSLRHGRWSPRQHPVSLHHCQIFFTLQQLTVEFCVRMFSAVCNCVRGFTSLICSSLHPTVTKHIFVHHSRES